ncbi:MAG: DMT family transporter [Clostridia bacterium]|nr:DMT family transporter [Clostridia bacterium]
MRGEKVFSNRISSLLLALAVCALWGSLYPFVKLGYDAFSIDGGDVPSIILFAGVRFAVCGVAMAVLFSAVKGRLLAPKREDAAPVFTVALFSVILHYLLTYIALAVGEGSKSAIIKQIGFLFLSCMSFLFIKNERFSYKKLFCGCLGFSGIVVTSMDGSAFSFALGDLLLVLSSFCAVIGTVATKKAVKRTEPLVLVAYSQLFGGVLLLLAGLAFGGRIAHVDLGSAVVFAYICVASICAYALWNVLIKYNSVSKLSMIKFTEPLFAVLFSGLLLRENILKWNYAAAMIIIFTVILLDNGFIRKRRGKGGFK